MFYQIKYSNGDTETVCAYNEKEALLGINNNVLHLLDVVIPLTIPEEGWEETKRFQVGKNEVIHYNHPEIPRVLKSCVNIEFIDYRLE